MRTYQLISIVQSGQLDTKNERLVPAGNSYNRQLVSLKEARYTLEFSLQYTLQFYNIAAVLNLNSASTTVKSSFFKNQILYSETSNSGSC
jgi:hypothetical protein